MLKKLRFKFVCINMVLLMTMLCVILGLVVHFTRSNLEAESFQMMQAAASRPFGPGLPDQTPEDLRLSCFTVRIDHGRLVARGYTGLSEEELQALVAAAVTAGTPTGILEEYSLRYLWAGGPEKCLVFADVSREQATLAHLSQTCALASLVGFGAFLLISFFLARWAVKPVERAWEQQRQFVADASHELKTPLTVILTDAELLQSQNAGPLAGSILTMAHQMWGLVESLLDLARADSGKPEQTELDLSKLVSDAALPFEALFFERGMILTEEIDASIKAKGNSTQLRQAVDIFLDNAQKYSAPGEVVLRLSRKGRSRCLLSVSSPGEPILQEELSNIFKRFYRLDKARRRDGSYGLGLSIVQSIAAAHHGKTWAESGEEGNLFFLELPVL